MIPTPTSLEGRIDELERLVRSLVSGNVLENASLELESGQVVTTVEMAEAPVVAAGAAETAAEAATAAGEAQTAADAATDAVAAAQDAITAAGAAAAAAQDAADAASSAAADATEAAGQALVLVNGKSTTYVGAVLPAVPDGGHRTNDEWVDTSSGAAVLRTWDGDSWEVQAWGSGALSAGSVTAGAIAAGAVVTAALAAEAVTAAKILTGTITAGQIASGTITAGLIAAGAITTAKLAAGAVTTTELAAGAVTAAKITAGTITGAEIAAGAITAAKIVGGTITAAEIASGTITGDRIAGNTIDAGKLTATAIDGKTITGATIRTSDPAVQVQRIQLDSTAGFRAFNSAGTVMTSVDPATGLLTATGAVLSGSLTVGSGSSISKIDTSGIYAGNAAFASAPFRVSPAGALTATNATITGEIRTAASGARVRIVQETVTTDDPLATTRGLVELHGASGTAAFLRNLSDSYDREVMLDSGTYAGTAGPRLRFLIIPPEGVGTTARQVEFDRLDLLTLVGASLATQGGFSAGGVTVGTGIAATGSVTSDSNLTAGNAVVVGSTTPSAGHAVRRDWVEARVQSGSATFTFPAANTTYSQTISVPAMVTTPAVVVTGVNNAPHQYFYAVGGLTNSSFTLYGRATVTGSSTCRWVAVSI